MKTNSFMKKTFIKNRYKSTACLLAAMAITAGCCSQYRITGVQRSRILVDSIYDAKQNYAAAEFIAPYKRKVDSIMSPVTGRTAEYMYAERPESNLSNLLADILIWAGKNYDEKPVFAVYNIGGIRAALAKGDITYGDVLDMAPFENKICFVTLKGDKVMELFGQIASVGGEGISHGVELEITEDGKLISAKINGNKVDTGAGYRIATLDYLAQGNDKLEAFKSSKEINSPEDTENNVRFIIMKYMKEKLDMGLEITSKKEGRIRKVKNEE